MAQSFRDKFTNYLFASYPLLWVQTHEEIKVCADILGASESNKELFFHEWDCMTGIAKLEKGKEKVNRRLIANTAKPQDALEYIKNTKDERQVFILKDFHPFFQNPAFVRSIRNLVEELKNKGNMIVFVSPLQAIPTELEKDVQMLDYKLPDEEALGHRLEYVIDSALQEAKSEDAKKKLAITAEVKRNAVEASKGMTDSEAENAFTLAIVENKKFDQSFVKTVFNEKIAQVKKNSLLTYLEPDFGFENVGGLVGLKNWINLRSKAFEEKAREYGLPYPKGVLLAGIPGCGKTMLAKATAHRLGFPLFQLDIGSLFGKLVGETEENFRKVIKIVEGLGRCVLFIDEIEKGLSRSAVSGQGDTGTSSRSFATLLSWLSDHTSPVFVIGTSNKFLELPPELIRKGRFDELFWIDLPDDKEREDIFKVLLARFKWKPDNFKLDELSEYSEGFTGAEIEDVIKSTMFKCYADGGRDIKTKDLLGELNTIIPQSKVNEGDISAMRQAAKGKLRIAAEDGSTIEVEKASRKISMSK